MRTILKIIGTQEKRDKDNRRYYKTLALVDTGDECWGYGSEYEVGDKVEVFFHYGEIKMRRGLDKSSPNA